MTDPTPAPRRLSLLLWVSGGLLWLIVAALIFVNYRRAGEPPNDAQSSRPVAAQPAGGPPAGGLVEPRAIWSEDGVGDFSLTERSGETVTKQDLLGKPWIVGFVFTRCAGPCPRVTGQMRKLQDQLKDVDFRLVTMTVDPEFDTPEVLTNYAGLFGADEKKWMFLTGDKETMYRYIEEHFKMPVEETEGEARKPGFEVIHTTNLMLVDGEGVVRAKYNALVPEEMEKLKRELKELSSGEPRA